MLVEEEPMGLVCRAVVGLGLRGWGLLFWGAWCLCLMLQHPNPFQ